MSNTPPPELGAPNAPDVPSEEERLLARVEASLAERQAAAARPLATTSRFNQELVALRDEIGEARLEDVPALIAQMERLSGISGSRAEAQGVLVDAGSPYFGHLRLRERRAGRPEIERDVLIGKATYLDPGHRVNIVDWRHAPVSQLYYRYEEGSDYEERFGSEDVEGEVLARRTVTIENRRLLRIASADDIWVRGTAGWERAAATEAALAGGELTATRPGAPRVLGASASGAPHVLGANTTGAPRGMLGAGAAGTRQQRLDRHLPEIAALIDPRQFELITAPDAGLVVIQGGAGSGKTTIGLHRIAYLAFAHPNRFPPKRMRVVTYGAALAAYIEQVLPALGVHGVRVLTFAQLAAKELRKAIPWLGARIVDDAPAAATRVKNHPALLHELESRARAVRAAKGKRNARAVLDLWAEVLTDKARLLTLLTTDEETPVSASAVEDAHRTMSERVAAVLARDPREREPAPERDAPEPDDEDVRGDIGIDGAPTEDEEIRLDLEDAAMLLRAHQILRGTKRPFAHVFVDEAQDLSPMQLAVLIGQTELAGKTKTPSITLAGDTSQKLFLDNGFVDWRHVLHHLALDHVAIEPLRIAYRSTRQILALARHAMGPLADEVPPVAPRSGAEVEAHRLPGAGAAVAFLAEALRPLFAREPRATVAIIARHPEQADLYFNGLQRAEVPGLRRVRAQDFSFRPGIDVTDVRQIKGLEFDYVVLVDVNASTYGRDDESRHLFHIAATRAAHQLWLVVTATPSRLIPEALLSGPPPPVKL